MACTTINSMLKSCGGNNIGGIYEVYIHDTDAVGGTGINVSAHTISAMTSTTDFSIFQFNRNIGNFTVEPSIDLINGSTFYTATITLQFNRREGSKSRALTILGEGQRYLSIIVKSADGTYTYFDYMQLNGGAEESGTVKADGSKYTVTFVGELETRPYFIDSSVVTTLTT